MPVILHQTFLRYAPRKPRVVPSLGSLLIVGVNSQGESFSSSDSSALLFMLNNRHTITIISLPKAGIFKEGITSQFIKNILQVGHKKTIH